MSNTPTPADPQKLFIEALNPSIMQKANLFRLQTAGKTDELNDEVRKIIGTKKPEELLDAMKKAYPQAEKLVEAIKKDPALAQAFHKAVVKDPTVLPGMAKLATGTGSGSVSFADIETMITDPAHGSDIRQMMTDGLNQVADDSDMNFDDLMSMAQTGKQMLGPSNGRGGMGLAGLFDTRRMREDPRGMIRDFMSSFMPALQGTSFGNMIAGILDKILPIIGGLFNPNGFMLKPYTEYANYYLRGSMDSTRATGAEVLAPGNRPGAAPAGVGPVTPPAATGSAPAATGSTPAGNGPTFAPVTPPVAPGTGQRSSVEQGQQPVQTADASQRFERHEPADGSRVTDLRGTMRDAVNGPDAAPVAVVAAAGAEHKFQRSVEAGLDSPDTMTDGFDLAVAGGIDGITPAAKPGRTFAAAGGPKQALTHG